jgi:UV excision repair protein RAD23
MPASSAASGIASDSEVAPHQPEPNIPAATPPEVIQDSTATSDSAPSSLGDPGTFLSGDSLQGAINNIMDMGFPRDQVLQAMRASFNKLCDSDALSGCDNPIIDHKSASKFIPGSFCLLFFLPFSLSLTLFIH